jgi:hypothetical protein
LVLSVQLTVDLEEDPRAAANAVAEEETFGLAPLLEPIPDGDFVFVVALDDGQEICDRIVKAVHSRPCLTLQSDSALTAMCADDEAFAVSRLYSTICIRLNF